MSIDLSSLPSTSLISSVNSCSPVDHESYVNDAFAWSSKEINISSYTVKPECSPIKFSRKSVCPFVEFRTMTTLIESVTPSWFLSKLSSRMATMLRPASVKPSDSSSATTQVVNGMHNSKPKTNHSRIHISLLYWYEVFLQRSHGFARTDYQGQTR